MDQPFSVGDMLEGKVVGIKSFGAFIELAGGKTGLVHISQICDGYVKDINEQLKLGDTVPVRVMGLEGGKINLSIKAAARERGEGKKAEPKPAAPQPGSSAELPAGDAAFESMMSSFKKRSDEKIGELKRSINNRRGGGYSRRGGGKF